MKTVHRILRVCSVIAVCPFLMGAVSITIVTPPDGNGALWNCSVVNGTTTNCPNGSPVTGASYKWNGTSYVFITGSGLNTVGTTNNTWNTTPMTGTGKYTAAGNYKVSVVVTAGTDTDTDDNFWTIP